MTFASSDSFRLDSWKAVAVYFGRDERTVRRWESERGLPIYRLPGGKRSQIYAEISELDAWLRGLDRSEPVTIRNRALERTRSPTAVPATRRVEPRRGAASAEELCIEGERAWTERTSASLNLALDAFNSVVRLDPSYAKAYVGLAKTYILLREFTLLPDAQAYAMARNWARRALELDESLAQAHVASAFVDFWGFWDASSARRSFARGIELDSNSALARHWFATFLNAQADHQAAVKQIDLALALDPESPAIQADRGQLLFYAGRKREAVDVLQSVALANPTFSSPQKYLAGLYLLLGQDRDYLSQAESLAALTRDRSDAAALAAARVGYDVAGRRGMLAAMIADRLERARSGTVSAYTVARLYALSNDEPSALHWLQKSIDKREMEFVYIIFDMAFSDLRRGQAFREFVAQVRPLE